MISTCKLYNNPLQSQLSAQVIIQRLVPYITKQRQQRIEQCLQQRIGDIHLALESIADIHNALATIRSCEAFGVVHIHLIAPEGSVKTSRRLTQGAHHWMCIHQHRDLIDFLAFATDEQLHIAGAMPQANTSISAIPIDQPICLLLGNEHRGLSHSAQQHCDFHYRIPMHGMTESFNLSVAAAISLYDVTSRKRELLHPATGNLSLQEKKNLRANHYMHSLDQRIVQGILLPTQKKPV